MAKINSGATQVVALAAGQRLRFNSGLTGTYVVTLAGGKVLPVDAIEGPENVGPFQDNASISVTATANGSYWSSYPEGETTIVVTSADIADAPYQTARAVLIRDVPGGATYPTSWDGTAYSQAIKSLVSGGGIPSSLRACIPGRDPSTSFLDVSGNTATLTVDAGNTGAFAAPDYFSSIAGNTTGLLIAAAKSTWTPASQSAIFAFTLKKAIPAGSQNLCAWGGSITAGAIGFYLSHRVTTGAIKIVPIIAGAVVNAQSDSTLGFSDAVNITLSGTFTGTTGNATLTYSTTLPPEVAVGYAMSGAAGVPAGVTITAINRATNVVTISSNLTADVTAVALTIKPVVDHHCVVAYDAPSGSWYIYRDGVLSNAFLNQMVGANAYPANTSTTLGIRWGSTSDVTPATVVAASGYGLQAYVINGGLPINIGLLAAKLAASPRAPLSSVDLA